LIRNLDWFRNLPPDVSLNEVGARLYEALADIDRQAANVEQQTNSNRTGEPPAPPPITGLTVSAANGHFQIAISDQNQTGTFRGLSYWIEHADNPHFKNAHVIELGTGRNADLYLGNVKRYFRAYSAYAGSAPNAPVYFGGATPKAVQGGGKDSGPLFLASEGSGTGLKGQQLQGPGVVPFRSTNGKVPTR
jgi:hypothetical protein